MRWFNNQIASQLLNNKPHIRVFCHQHALGDGNVERTPNPFGHRLVDGYRTGANTRAGVRNSQIFKHALNGSVFTKATMQRNHRAVVLTFFQFGQIIALGIKARDIHPSLD